MATDTPTPDAIDVDVRVRILVDPDQPIHDRDTFARQVIAALWKARVPDEWFDLDGETGYALDPTVPTVLAVDDPTVWSVTRSDVAHHAGRPVTVEEAERVGDALGASTIGETVSTVTDAVLDDEDQGDAHTSVCAAASSVCDEPLYDMGGGVVLCGVHGGDEDPDDEDPDDEGTRTVRVRNEHGELVAQRTAPRDGAPVWATMAQLASEYRGSLGYVIENTARDLVTGLPVRLTTARVPAYAEGVGVDVMRADGDGRQRPIARCVRRSRAPLSADSDEYIRRAWRVDTLV